MLASFDGPRYSESFGTHGPAGQLQREERGKMSVFRRKTSKGLTKHYHYRFVVRGQLYSGSTGETDERQAKKYEKKLRATIQQSENVRDVIEKARKAFGGSSIPVEDGFDAFLVKPRQTAMGARRGKTERAYWTDFTTWAKEQGVEQLGLVTPQHAEQYIHMVRTSGRHIKRIVRKRGRKILTVGHCQTALSAGTQVDILQCLKKVFRYLWKEAGCAENPFEHIQPPRKQVVHRQAFTPEELKKIGEASKGTWIYDLFLTGICTGLREGDICTLRWDEVDLAKGWITRIPRKTRKNSGKEVRIPIMPALGRHLRSLNRDSEHVFPLLVEEYQNGRANLGREITEFLEGIDIASTIQVEGRGRRVSVKDVHSLRHTFCYIAAVNGIPLPIVQSIVGHMNAEMTQMYMDHATDEAKQMMMRLPVYMAGELPAESAPPAKLTEADLPDILAKITGELQGMTKNNWERIRDMVVGMIESESPAPAQVA